jgi:Uma2 family endonuclease
MSVMPKRFLTAAEYLAIERAAETKSEYFNGEMFAMGGTSEPHNTIVGNILETVRPQARKVGCKTYFADVRLKISDSGLYAYPDIVIACEPKFEDEVLDTLLNPAIIFEVLSSSTEAHDRGFKWAHYQQLSSLKNYVLVSQESTRLEMFSRKNDAWIFTSYTSLDATLALDVVSVSLSLRDVYSQVELTGSA